MVRPILIAALALPITALAMDAGELRNKLGQKKRANARAERELSPTDNTERLDALEGRDSARTSDTHSNADRSGARSDSPRSTDPATGSSAAPAEGRERRDATAYNSSRPTSSDDDSSPSPNGATNVSPDSDPEASTQATKYDEAPAGDSGASTDTTADSTNSADQSQPDDPEASAQATKYDDGSSRDASGPDSAAPASGGTNAPGVGAQGDTYIPPSRSDGTSSVALTSASNDDDAWGVRIGTWAAATLTRSVSSADSSAIELELVEPLSGEHRNVPAGATLFAEGSFNEGTRRLTLEVTKAITPDGREFSLSATVYDESKRAGLPGTVVRDRGEEVKAAASDGALTLAESVIGTVTGSGAAGEAAGSTAEELLKQEEKTQKEAPQAVIRTNPQRALIRVNESF